MGIWDWITGTARVDSILSTLGLGALAVLFATNRIITKGQHEARVADLKGFHERELAGKDERIDALDESRRYWRDAAESQRSRADKVTDMLGEFTELGRLSVHALTAIDEAATRGGVTDA